MFKNQDQRTVFILLIMVLVFVFFFLYLFVPNSSNNNQYDKNKFNFNIPFFVSFCSDFSIDLYNKFKNDYLSHIFSKKNKNFKINIVNYIFFKSVSKIYKKIKMTVYGIIGLKFILLRKNLYIPQWIVEWKKDGFPPLYDLKITTDNLSCDYIAYNDNDNLVFIFFKDKINLSIRNNKEKLYFLKQYFKNIINLNFNSNLVFRLNMMKLGNKIKEIYND